MCNDSLSKAAGEGLEGLGVEQSRASRWRTRSNFSMIRCAHAGIK